MASKLISILRRNVSVLSDFTRPEFIPKFSPGTSSVSRVQPQDYTIDCSQYQLNLDKNEVLRERISDVFKHTGLVYLTNTGTVNAITLKNTVRHVMGKEDNYEGGGNPRASVDGVFDTGVSNDQTIHFHHEMQYMHQSIRTIAFMCLDLTPGADGSTYFSDNIAYTDDMRTREIGRKMEKGVRIVRRWTNQEYFKGKSLNNYYNHWQVSFQTDDPDVAEQRAKALSLVNLQWDSLTGLLSAEYYPETFEYCPVIDRNLYYRTISDHALWFDTDKNVAHVPDQDRPQIMTFADGRNFTREEIIECIEVADKYSLKLDWKPGQIAVACNYRFLHGRPGISLPAEGIRKMGVVLGERFDRMGPLPGKY